jgi:hypothetical protein
MGFYTGLTSKADSPRKRKLPSHSWTSFDLFISRSGGPRRRHVPGTWLRLGQRRVSASFRIVDLQHRYRGRLRLDANHYGYSAVSDGLANHATPLSRVFRDVAGLSASMERTTQVELIAARGLAEALHIWL